MAVKAKDNPWESWTPRTTGNGMYLYRNDMRPVAPRRRRTEAVEIPAAAICGRVRSGDSVMATEAIDFIGWTGMGIPNKRPVTMLYKAVKIRVVPRSSFETRVKAKTIGM